MNDPKTLYSVINNQNGIYINPEDVPSYQLFSIKIKDSSLVKPAGITTVVTVVAILVTIANYTPYLLSAAVAAIFSTATSNLFLYPKFENFLRLLRLTGYGSLCTLANLRTCTNLWNEVFPVTSHIQDLNKKGRLLINQLKMPRSKGDSQVLPTVEVLA